MRTIDVTKLGIDRNFLRQCENQKLIHTPTMRIPSIIKDRTIIYHCMRSCLMMAIKNRVKSIVIPAFGGGCGEVEPEIIARMMSRGYQQILNPPKQLDWDYAVPLPPQKKDT